MYVSVEQLLLQVVRSDFFPGLGWMMNRQLWNEIGATWPTGYWDDWIREPVSRKLFMLPALEVDFITVVVLQEQRKAREVLRPEVSKPHKPNSRTL